jgi:hypothetical protein
MTYWNDYSADFSWFLMWAGLVTLAVIVVWYLLDDARRPRPRHR